MQMTSVPTDLPVVKIASGNDIDLIINRLSGNAAQNRCPFSVICNGRCQTSDLITTGHVPDAEEWGAKQLKTCGTAIYSQHEPR